MKTNLHKQAGINLGELITSGMDTYLTTVALSAALAGGGGYMLGETIGQSWRGTHSPDVLRKKIRKQNLTQMKKDLEQYRDLDIYREGYVSDKGKDIHI